MKKSQLVIEMRSWQVFKGIGIGVDNLGIGRHVEALYPGSKNFSFCDELHTKCHHQHLSTDLKDDTAMERNNFLLKWNLMLSSRLKSKMTLLNSRPVTWFWWWSRLMFVFRSKMNCFLKHTNNCLFLSDTDSKAELECFVNHKVLGYFVTVRNTSVPIMIY